MLVNRHHCSYIILQGPKVKEFILRSNFQVWYALVISPVSNISYISHVLTLFVMFSGLSHMQLWGFKLNFSLRMVSLNWNINLLDLHLPSIPFFTYFEISLILPSKMWLLNWEEGIIHMDFCNCVNKSPFIFTRQFLFL